MKGFQRQRKILEELELQFETGKFIKNFVREIFLQLFRLFGLEIKKAKNN
jgi:hypothetical protein